MSYLSDMEYGVEIERFGESYRVDVIGWVAYVGKLELGRWQLVDSCRWDGTLDGIEKCPCHASCEASEIVLRDLAAALVEFESRPGFAIEEEE